MPNDASDRDDIAARIAELARSTGRTVAAAESLTGGMVSAALAAAQGAGQWYRGALVAYSSEVKHEVLAVPEGPVVSAEAARAMAAQVRRLLRADVAVAVSGAGGPDPQDGCAPGTVFVAVDDGARAEAVRHELPGEPGEVCAGAAQAALAMLAERLRSARPR